MKTVNLDHKHWTVGGTMVNCFPESELHWYELAISVYIASGGKETMALSRRAFNADGRPLSSKFCSLHHIGPGAHLNDFWRVFYDIRGRHHGTVYISGKITGLPNEVYVPKFKEAALKMNSAGFRVINPVELPDDHEKTWKAYMKVDLLALKSCTHLYALNNWQDSPGAMVEVWFAKRYNKQIIYQTNDKTAS